MSDRARINTAGEKLIGGSGGMESSVSSPGEILRQHAHNPERAEALHDSLFDTLMAAEKTSFGDVTLVLALLSVEASLRGAGPIGLPDQTVTSTIGFQYSHAAHHLPLPLQWKVLVLQSALLSFVVSTSRSIELQQANQREGGG